MAFMNDRLMAPAKEARKKWKSKAPSVWNIDEIDILRNE